MPGSHSTSAVLLSYLDGRIGSMHSSISLREDDGTAALADFIERYVALVPDFITAFEDFLKSTGISGELARQIATAKEFLETPADIISTEDGLEANMYQAYLAHRLLEEVNELLRSHFNCPVIPVDMTRSNLVVHHIIGEPFANQMDSAILLLLDKLITAIESDKSLRAKLFVYTSQSGNDLTEQYPCLTESSNIRLLFKSQNSRVRLN